ALIKLFCFFLKQKTAYEIGENSRFKKDANTGRNLDQTDHQHNLVTATADKIVRERRQVLIPVYEQVEEFIQPRQDWGDGETKAENLKSLLAILIFCHVKWIAS